MVDREASTTVYEIMNDGSSTVFELRDAVVHDAALRRLVAHTRRFFDGDSFVGLPRGTLGDYGVVVREETLAFTDGFLSEMFDAADPQAVSSSSPSYLDLTAPTAWDPEYPSEFRERLPALAGYLHYSDTDIPGGPAGYFVSGERHEYDFQQPGAIARGLRCVSRSWSGNDTIGYGDYQLLRWWSRPIGLEQRASCDLATSAIAHRGRQCDRHRILTSWILHCLNTCAAQVVRTMQNQVSASSTT